MEDEVKDETRQRSFINRLHIFSTTLTIMIGMGMLDGYLVDQNYGNRKIGVLVMLLIGDACLLFILRYVAVWVGKEVTTVKRGSSMAEWVLFIFTMDMKMYFVLEGVKKVCSFMESFANENIQKDVKTSSSSNVLCCEYSLFSVKILTFLQAILISGLYFLLLGADYIKNIPDYKGLEEIKMRAFWIVMDLWDILELQSSMWELKQGQLPYFLIGFIYFYCSIVLIILAPVSLTEISKRTGEIKPHKMLTYLLVSLCLVNVGATVIRAILLLRHKFAATSTIFIGKDILCFGLKVTKLIQIRMLESGALSFNDEFDGRTNGVLTDLSPTKCTSIDITDAAPKTKTQFVNKTSTNYSSFKKKSYTEKQASIESIICCKRIDLRKTSGSLTAEPATHDSTKRQVDSKLFPFLTTMQDEASSSQDNSLTKIMKFKGKSQHEERKKQRRFEEAFLTSCLHTGSRFTQSHQNLINTKNLRDVSNKRAATLSPTYKQGGIHDPLGYPIPYNQPILPPLSFADVKAKSAAPLADDISVIVTQQNFKTLSLSRNAVVKADQHYLPKPLAAASISSCASTPTNHECHSTITQLQIKADDIASLTCSQRLSVESCECTIPSLLRSNEENSLSSTPSIAGSELAADLSLR